MRWNGRTVGPRVERLERRALLSTATLRIVSYNIEADIDGYTTPRPGMATVLEGIGAEDVYGTTRPIDVLALQETTSNAATVAPIVTSLNSFYGAGTYAQSTYQATESNNDPTTGNGPNALIYNTTTVDLLATVPLQTQLSSSSGINRQVVRYEFEPVGGGTGSKFYIYVSHYKSGTTAADQTERQEEAAAIRADETTLPADAHVLYVGDFNSADPTEAQFQTLTASGQGQAVDPLGLTTDPDGTTAGQGVLTESATDLQYRDDFEMVTSNVLTDSSGLELVAGSYHAFGNNGTVGVGDAIDAGSNTALAGLSNRTDVLSALTTASDHLPIVADYTDPVSGGTSTTGATLLDFNAASAENFGKNNYKAATIDSSIVNNLGLTRGAGVKTSGTAAHHAWGGEGWASTAAAATAAGDYIEFGFVVQPNDVVSLSAIGMKYRRTTTGPTNALWQYELNGGTWADIAHITNAFPSARGTGSSIPRLDLNHVGALQGLAAGTSVRIRLVPYGGSSSSGALYVFHETGNDLVLNGSVFAAVASGRSVFSEVPAFASTPAADDQLLAVIDS